MKHVVEVTIPAVITLRGKIEAESSAEAKAKAEVEAAVIVEHFTEAPVLSGIWPEVLGKASVEARTAKRGKVTVRVES
ncbi:MAG TPA: hypothetical protein VLH75_07255 [Longimicrobiales bacterium]|nr:hypothetical protein [Longimicrobiales bacterium]